VLRQRAAGRQGDSLEQSVRSIAAVLLELVAHRQHRNKLRVRDFVKSHVADGPKRDDKLASRRAAAGAAEKGRGAGQLRQAGELDFVSRSVGDFVEPSGGAYFVEDLTLADRAVDEIELACLAQLSRTPALFRRSSGSPTRRELVIPFGVAGYVALYEIASSELVLVLAVRHQLEEDDRD